MRLSVLLVFMLSISLFGEELVVDSVVNQEDTTNRIDTVVTTEVEAVSDTIPADNDSAIEATVGKIPASVSQSDTTGTATTATSVNGSIDEKKVEVTETKNVAATASVEKIKLRKRHFNYRQQVGLAVGMMAFIVVMMTTAQSLNPK